MGLLSAAMLIETGRMNSIEYRSLRLGFPDGAEYYSSVALCTNTIGFHNPLVLRWGVIEDDVSDRADAIQIPRWTGLQILDKSGQLARRVKLYDLHDVSVALTVLSPNVRRQEDWLLRFSGIIHDLDEKDRVVTITSGPDDRPLRAKFPKQRFSQADFPNLPKGSEQLYIPISPYGRHDSFGLGNIDGQIQPVYVGEYTETNLEEDEVTGSKFIIGLWPGREILHAYADDVRLSENTWIEQAIQETVNGRTYFRIMFNTNRSAQKITLDVRGIEVDGDGLGRVIEDPVKQALHLASNLWYNEVLDPTVDGYMDEADVPQIDWPYADETTDHIDSRLPAGVRGSRYIPASETQQVPIDLLDESSASYHYKWFWSYAGKLCARPDNMDHPGYLDYPWFVRQYHELEPLQPIIESQGTIGRIMVEGAYGEALGQFQQKLLVVSQRASPLAESDSIQGIWLQALISLLLALVVLCA